MNIHLTQHAVQRFIERYKNIPAQDILWYVNLMINNAEKHWLENGSEYFNYGGLIFVCKKGVISDKKSMIVLTMIQSNTGFAKNIKSPSTQTPGINFEEKSQLLFKEIVKYELDTILSNEDPITVPEEDLHKKRLRIHRMNSTLYAFSNRFKYDGRLILTDLSIPTCECRLYIKLTTNGHSFLCPHIEMAAKHFKTFTPDMIFNWENSFEKLPMYITNQTDKYYNSKFVECDCPFCNQPLDIAEVTSKKHGLSAKMLCYSCNESFNCESKIWISTDFFLRCQKRLYLPDKKQISLPLIEINLVNNQFLYR